MKNEELFKKICKEVGFSPIGRSKAEKLAEAICKLQVEACQDALMQNYEPLPGQLKIIENSKIF